MCMPFYNYHKINATPSDRELELANELLQMTAKHQEDMETMRRQHESIIGLSKIIDKKDETIERYDQLYKAHQRWLDARCKRIEELEEQAREHRKAMCIDHSYSIDCEYDESSY